MESRIDHLLLLRNPRVCTPSKTPIIERIPYAAIDPKGGSGTKLLAIPSRLVFVLVLLLLRPFPTRNEKRLPATTEPQALSRDPPRETIPFRVALSRTVSTVRFVFMVIVEKTTVEKALVRPFTTQRKRTNQMVRIPSFVSYAPAPVNNHRDPI